jgi:hypothetical protein
MLLMMMMMLLPPMLHTLLRVQQATPSQQASFSHGGSGPTDIPPGCMSSAGRWAGRGL